MHRRCAAALAQAAQRLDSVLVAAGLIAATVLVMLPVSSWATTEPGWQLAGDLRAGLTAGRRDQRDGTSTDSDRLRARARVRLATDPAPNWRFSARVAGTFASDQDRFSAWIRRHRPSPTGLEPGDITLDELYFSHRSESGNWRFGRFQTGFVLPLVPAKSLDRNDSSNFDIGWTDGVHLSLPAGEHWRAHLIAQANSSRGTGNTARQPLDFVGRHSRASLYLGLEATEPAGPLIMRMVGLTVMPDSLAHEGPDARGRQHYVAATARIAAQQLLGDEGMRLVFAAELGQAPNRPRAAAVGLDGRARVSGTAYQLGASLYDIRPDHHLGLVWGRAGAGWLISNDYRPNDELAELRYQRRFSPQLSMEIRYRWRRELETPADVQHRRRDRDVYLRLSARF